VVHIEAVLVAQLDDRALVAPAGLCAITDAITRAELIMRKIDEKCPGRNMDDGASMNDQWKPLSLPTIAKFDLVTGDLQLHAFYR
jgi:hypothetical protein